MRLNIRLAAMLKGITFVGDIGHMLLRSSHVARTGRNSKGNAAALPILGLALWLLGWLGGLAAGFIKAAISRQKKFLADASAVQYTRNPEGIGDALRVIGAYLPGTLVHAARAADGDRRGLRPAVPGADVEQRSGSARHVAQVVDVGRRVDLGDLTACEVGHPSQSVEVFGVRACPLACEDHRIDDHRS